MRNVLIRSQHINWTKTRGGISVPSNKDLIFQLVPLKPPLVGFTVSRFCHLQFSVCNQGSYRRKYNAVLIDLGAVRPLSRWSFRALARATCVRTGAGARLGARGRYAIYICGCAICDTIMCPLKCTCFLDRELKFLSELAIQDSSVCALS